MVLCLFLSPLITHCSHHTSAFLKSLNEQIKNKFEDSSFVHKLLTPVLPTVGSDEKKTKLKSKLASYVASKTNTLPQGVSTALDARLENGVELTAELKLKVCIFYICFSRIKKNYDIHCSIRNYRVGGF